LLARKTIRWVWPLKKFVIIANKRPSGGLIQQTLVLQTDTNTKIKAVASGVVMYAGKGVSGQGRLIIIEHNRSFMSIYGNTQESLVAKNEIVKAGQTIAEIGSTGMQEPKLHFEIRRNGKPVDPLNYLPKQ